MKRRSNKIISLFEFIKTGKFDIVELGLSKEQIINLFCKPDNKNDMKNNMSIWNYSTFELHFYKDNLMALWCDNLSYLKNPHKKQFRFDKWVFSRPKLLTFSYFCSVLKKEQIGYKAYETFFKYSNNHLADNIILYIDNTNVHIYFEDTDDTATSIMQYHLVGIGCSECKSLDNTKEITI